jgi:hypothetical protein
MIISPPLSFIIFDFTAFLSYFDRLSRRRQIAPPPPAFLTAGAAIENISLIV